MSSLLKVSETLELIGTLRARFRQFAEIMVIHRADLEAADSALADACHRHGVTYHGIWSDW